MREELKKNFVSEINLEESWGVSLMPASSKTVPIKSGMFWNLSRKTLVFKAGLSNFFLENPINNNCEKKEKR